ncbi:MAG TPA: 3-deoxy-D-manno-octulosonic acid transferase [Terriglobales bacterium]|nr:3-deoxy-D-manno-octulosonic acid transferase [Terriglobales bacterium]
MYWIYSAVLGTALLLSLPYWLLQSIRHGKYRRGLRERLGRVPSGLTRAGEPTLWVHAVSVGEVLAVSQLVDAFQARHPAYRVVVSTTTDTGQNLALKKFGEGNVFYFPLDFGFAIRPYLEALRPQLVVVAETEFWPNFLRLTHRSGARVAIVNARISDKSWPGYRRFRWLLNSVLRNVDLFLTQTEEDRKRLIDIGAPAHRVQVSGNLKFDVPPPPSPPIVSSLRANFEQAGATPILVCGSTVDDEEPLLLQAFQNVLASYPKAVMILAPRHPERFAEVAKLLDDLGVQHWRRSLWSGERIVGGVLLIDTIGELASLYALADIAFVGGSLVPRGGHNIIEPAQHGVPIVVGNHTENFRDIVGLFQSRNAVRVVGPAEFPLTLMELISQPEERVALGRRAAETLRSQTGATAHTLDALENLLNV